MFTYSISVLAMFKNESRVIKDWIDHYLAEGVEHFYLIDNGSTDDTNDRISRYSSYITLIKDARRMDTGTQTFLLNHIYLNKIKNESEWLIICDVDEYIYARNKCVQIMEVLKKLPPTIEKIWIPWKCFGSNGHTTHPKHVIRSFTKRQSDISIQMEHGKVICRTQNLTSIVSSGNMVELSENNVYYLCNGQRLDQCKYNDAVFKALNLHLNHYVLMSEEYYKNTKCLRGGGESGHSTNKFTMPTFYTMNETCNEVEDTELAKKTYTFGKQMPKKSL
jgi:glycosyltransferase involved in cell wall biosynthesis